MRTLVTGGAGFIGSHLTDALLREGHDVSVVDDLSRGRRENVDGRASFIQLDVADPALADAIAAARPEVVFHQAAQVDVRVSVREPLHDTRVNVLGTVNVLRACADAGVRRVVFAGSGGAMYGDTETVPTPEDHAADPASPYGAAKVSGEEYGRTFERMHGLDFVALRYANVYGPRQDPHGEAGVVAIFSLRLLRGEAAVINGDGGQTRDYVYVDDVVAANLRALDLPSGGAFNVGTGVETDVNQIHARLRVLCGSARDAVHGPAKPGEQRRSCLDIARAREVLGWAPRTQLDEGLARTLDFFRAA